MTKPFALDPRDRELFRQTVGPVKPMRCDRVDPIATHRLHRTDGLTEQFPIPRIEREWLGHGRLVEGGKGRPAGMANDRR